MHKTLKIITHGQGLYDFTQQVSTALSTINIRHGLCNLFVRHTSCSMTIQENADPSARKDLENWLNRLVPENDPLYTHIAEGADDMPAHIKSILTQTSMSIPVIDGQLALGVWQGVYLWEHRHGSQQREIILQFLSD